MEIVVRTQNISNNVVQEAADLYFDSEAEYEFDEKGNFRRAVGSFGSTIEVKDNLIILKASGREICWMLSALAGVALVNQVEDKTFWKEINTYIKEL